MGLASGCGFGFLWLGIYASYALSLWYGVTLILEERHLPVDERDYDAAVMITVRIQVVTMQIDYVYRF